MIVERTTIINYILPLDSQSSSKDIRDRTLEAFLQLYVTYVKKAREPNTAGYSWSNTQDQIILQWEGGESATMHILVVHAMIILLSFGPAHNEALYKEYKELKETWFPEKGKPPSAFLLDTSEEALLLPDWLKLRMIRSSAEPLIDAALQDLEPSQLLLFVQSFGIPVHSMSKLLQCLDNAATLDMASLEQSVLDKAYMAQLIEVQHKRGAKGGDKFYSMLTDGRKLEIHKDDEEMEVESAEDSVWKLPRPTETHIETIPASHVVNMILQAFDPSGRKSPDTETHFRALLMTVDRRNSGALDIIKGLNEILRGSTGGDFTKSIMHSVKACSLLRRIIAKQDEAGVKASLLETMEVLSKHCMGQKSLLSSMVHQYMLSQSKHKPQKAQLRTTEHQLYVEDLKKAELADTSELEIMVRESMKSAVASGGVPAATQLACSVLQCTKDSGLLPSTCALFVDWLELLDPEVIRLVPDLQEKLLFAKQAVSQSTQGREHSSQPYLLALLTHQSSWKILHRCINSLLTSSDKGYDPVTVLDFLWACIHIPKIWQGREKRMPKNQTVEDVLCLTGSQLIVLADYIIQEATSLSYNEPGTTKQSPVTIRNRIELLKACISGEPENVRELVLYIEKMMQIQSESTGFYEACLLELYLNYPYLLAWLSDTRCVTSEASVLPNSETQMDLITHRLITGLYQGSKSKDNSNKMSDVNTACRKLAAEHPVLMLRQLPAIVALLKGKTQFTFAEFKQRNLLMLYTYILGILELLQPNIFSKEHPALNHILEEYFNLLTAYSGHSHKQMGPLIVKLVQLLNQYVSYDSQRANSLLQKHVLLLTSVSSQFPDLSPLKSLLAGLTLPRHSHEDVGTPSGEPAGGSVYPVRPPSPWAASHLGPFIQKIKKDNSEEVLMVLQDLDETSKRKIEILEHFVDDFKRLLLAHNDQCRNTAFELVKRYIRQYPRQGVDFVPAFLHCLESDDPNVVMSALTNLAEFTMLCQDHADVILQKALSTGINTSVETSSYISESLQLLNLDLASG